jgi:hypothetical protein
MVAHTLPPGHPGTEFAPAGVLDVFPPTLVKEDEALPETADCRMVLWRHEFGIERECGSGVGRRPRAVVLRWRHVRMSGSVEILERRHDRGDRVLQHLVAFCETTDFTSSARSGSWPRE